MAYGQQTLAEAYSSDAFVVGTTDSRKAYVAVAAAWDSGGVEEVRLSYRLRWRCFYGPVNSHVIIPWTQKFATQDGSVGDVVEDGLWTSFTIRFRDYHHHLDSDDCEGAYLMSLRWRARGLDFHGNVSHYGSGQLHYWYFE